MFSTIMILIGSFVIGKTYGDKQIKQTQDNVTFQKEKEKAIFFVEETLYHNQLNSLYYIDFSDNAHIMQIQYQGQFYKIKIERLIGVNEYTYRIQELPSHQVYRGEHYKIFTQ